MTLELKLQTPKKPFIAGGPIQLELSLRNTGEAAEQAPAYTGQTQFEYLLLTEDGSRTIESISARKKDIARARGLTPKPVPRMQPVAPAGVLLYRDDLAHLAVQPIAPGKYMVQALYRMPGNVLIRSNTVPIEIIASRPTGTSQGLDLQKSELTAFEVIRDKDGRQSLRKWESRLSHPLLGRFSPLHTGVIAAVPTSVAMAVNVEEVHLGSWHWFAWTSGDVVQAQVTRAIDVKYSSAPFATGMTGTTLLTYGYQYADGHGLFLLAGMGSEGRRIRLLKLPADDEVPPTLVDVPLARTPDAPANATYYITPGVIAEVDVEQDGAADQPTATVDVASDASQASGRARDRTPPLRQELALSWVLRTSAATGFVMTRVEPDSAAIIAPPRTVLSIEREVVAHAIPPVAVTGMANAFAFLVAPSAERATFTRLTLDVHDTEQRDEWDLPPFLGGTLMAPHPKQWLLPSHHSTNAPVGAISRGRIWTVARNRDWKDTGIDVSKAASPIRLWTMPAGEYWCTWFDSELGYQLRRVA